LRTGQIDEQFYWIGLSGAQAGSETPSRIADKRARATG
jgi:hypothetical protein